ncbi:MAG TPA: hypothetical protein VNJ54_20930 [Plantibacter sp.]|uniref:hypothetical protein n=1 Tax=unclassified Plantibacter TaxID=2624265 RepID=UPI002CF66C91|nr:hypothetical protein [Plantibacter sp.]
MSVDLATMLVVSVIVCAGCGIFYALDSARTLSGRHMAAWLSGFASTLLSSVCYLAASYMDDEIWVVAIANASMVAAVAAVWVGCRLFNGRASLVIVGTFLVGVTFTAAILDPTDDREWAGSIAKFLILILLSVLIVQEARRGRLRVAPPAKVLVVVLGVHAAFTTVRLVIFVTVGHQAPIFDEAFSSAIVTNMNLVFVVAVAVGLILLRSWERKQRLASDRPGVASVSRRHFATAAAQRRAATHTGDVFTIIDIAIDDFAELRRAYGMASAGELEALLTEVVHRTIPAVSICSRVRNGGILVATWVTGGGSAPAELERMATLVALGYREAVAGQVTGFAGAAKLGIALEDGPGLPLDTLMTSAMRARAQAEQRGDSMRLVVPGTETTGR